jgi:peptidoglycan/LPS O-acetylase OafA/YrhL
LGINRLHSFVAFQSTNYFGGLDGLRAISILLVILHHTARWDSNLLSTLQHNGRYGVSFFFVISGFLICTLFLREQKKTGKIDLWKFYGRRAVRLLPLYYASLIIQAILIFGLHLYTPANQEIFWSNLPSYIFYYSNWLSTSGQGPFFCAWSLAVEEQFYIAFGLLIVFASRKHLIVAVVTALFLKILIYQLFGAIDASSTLWRVVFSYEEAILIGVLIAFVLNTQRGYELFAKCLRSPWVLTALGAATACWLLFQPIQSESSWWEELLYVLMALVLAGIVVRPRTPVLGGKVLTYVGRISYGMYLFHMFVISSVLKITGESPTFTFLLSVSLSVLAAALSYRYFECPIINKWKQRLSPLIQPGVPSKRSESLILSTSTFKPL